MTVLMERLINFAQEKEVAVGERPYCVEDYIKPSLEDALELPFDQLHSAANAGFKEAIDDISNVSGEEIATFLSFHPVFYHWVSSEFAQPYDSKELHEILSSAGATVERIISIHDDIYDCYRNLLGPNGLFSPKLKRPEKERAPQQDIIDLRHMLDWRDRELSTARSLASGLKCEFLLLHYKSRLASCGELFYKKSPVVYFSHPISHARKDIMSDEPQKRARGKNFQEDCQGFANHLSQQVCLIEPTAIDELRVAGEHLPKVTEEQLLENILPPLHERWPLNEFARLCGDVFTKESEGFTELVSEKHGKENRLGTLPVVLSSVELKVFRGFRCDTEKLRDLSSSLELLICEIRRQINVRDHVLADQSQLAIVFRPYSSPEKPELTGGVGAEIKAVWKKIESERSTCKPAIFVIHPPCDELGRRSLQLQKIWPGLDFHCDKRDVFYQECSEILLASKKENHVDVTESIFERCVANDVQGIAQFKVSTMASEEISQLREARKQFAKHLTKDVLFSHLDRLADDPGLKEWIELYEKEINHVTIAKEIVRIVETAKKG